jgi:hypothetical protein
MDCRFTFLRFSVQQNQFNKLIASSGQKAEIEYRNPKQTLANEAKIGKIQNIEFEGISFGI